MKLIKVKFVFADEDNLNSLITRTIPLDIIVNSKDTINLEYNVEIIHGKSSTATEVETKKGFNETRTKITIH
jgi:hypothetical protein